MSYLIQINGGPLDGGLWQVPRVPVANAWSHYTTGDHVAIYFYSAIGICFVYSHSITVDQLNCYLAK